MNERERQANRGLQMLDEAHRTGRHEFLTVHVAWEPHGDLEHDVAHQRKMFFDETSTVVGQWRHMEVPFPATRPTWAPVARVDSPGGRPLCTYAGCRTRRRRPIGNPDHSIGRKGPEDRTVG